MYEVVYCPTGSSLPLSMDKVSLVDVAVTDRIKHYSVDQVKIIVLFSVSSTIAGPHDRLWTAKRH